ncbi:hypothetical protein SAMN05216330_112179 [Bradyrhizobium sp. Ghvi]|nr:hypothetical protein SAMN05216330_112179 [Bradyrhizobium sp. Ghvi]
MKRLLASTCASLALTNCTGLDPSKLIPGAVSSFQSSIGATTAMEAKLIAAWQAENKGLLYLSGQDYNCGDPKSTLYKRYVAAKDPGTLVTEDHVNKYWTSSLEYVGAYLKLMTAISTSAQNDQKVIKQIVAIGTTAAGYIPDIPTKSATEALSALGTLATDVRGLIAVGQISDAAHKAQKPLATAVKYLKRYYPKFLAKEQAAFSAWDECANEKLIFIRDQPLRKIPTYQSNYFVAANGFELDNAYQAYLAQRQSYTFDATVQGIDKLLDQIIDENDKLANPTLTWEGFQTAVQTLDTLYTDLDKAASAVQAFGTPSKPVGVSKSASASPDIRAQMRVASAN